MVQPSHSTAGADVKTGSRAAHYANLREQHKVANTGYSLTMSIRVESAGRPIGDLR